MVAWIGVPLPGRVVWGKAEHGGNPNIANKQKTIGSSVTSLAVKEEEGVLHSPPFAFLDRTLLA